MTEPVAPGERQPYSNEAFVDAIVALIVDGDQVCVFFVSL